jgi:hypothetical protein
MNLKTVFLILTIILNLKGNALDSYLTKEFDEKIPSLTAPYIGPLYMTGCADSKMQKMLQDGKPVHIGEILPNKIRLFGDKDYPEEVYSFKEVSYYEVSTKNKKFYVMYIEAIGDSEKCEIIIELKGDKKGYYDRILCIIKEDKPETIILWIDNLKLLIKKEKHI